MGELEGKHGALRNVIESAGSLLVAYSGGVDSALVLKVAHDVLGRNVLAVTADSPSVPRREIDEAVRIAHTIGARHALVTTGELQDSRYAANPPNRCYFCKSALYAQLAPIARREGMRFVANGANLDDLMDYRPGSQAAVEYGVISPLREAGLTKSEVRELARQLRLEIWDKPATPCLSSRIPYGSHVTAAKLAAVEAAEDYVRSLNIRELRVRHFGSRARIETNLEGSNAVRQHLSAIQDRFRQLGFQEIELAPLRSGALNEGLPNR